MPLQNYCLCSLIQIAPASGNIWWSRYAYVYINVQFNASEGSYTWDFGDGSADVVTTTSPVVHSYNSTGTYTVSVKIPDSCGKFQYYQSFIIIASINGIQENSQQADMFKLYPNPNNGNFTLEIETNDNNSATLEIMNLCGQLIYRRQFSQERKAMCNEINLTNAAKGMYIVKMQTKNNSFVRKLIIE